jgi:hypothetical protein
MGTGQHPFPLPPVPYAIVIPTDSSFYLATCSRSFLTLLIFDPQDGVDISLRKVSSYTDCTALFPRRSQFSELPLWNLKSYTMLSFYIDITAASHRVFASSPVLLQFVFVTLLHFDILVPLAWLYPAVRLGKT